MIVFLKAAAEAITAAVLVNKSVLLHRTIQLKFLFLKMINKNVFCVKIKIDEVGRYFVIVFPKAAAEAITAAVLVRTSVLLY